MGSKTPVTILQELMTQMGTTPRYDLLYDGTGSQNPVFTYRVYAKNVSATGSGRTKKEAKHEAALAALKCFSLHKIQDSHPSEEPAEMVTSHEYKMEKNAIGEHHKMCATITTKCDIPIPGEKMVEGKEAQMEKIRSFVSLFNKKKEIENNVGIKTPVTILQELMIKMGTVPKYDLEYDGTGSHIPVFTYRVHANNVSATGSGRTKKEAKHVAALAALECMSLNQTEDLQPPQKPAERLIKLEYKIQENAIGEHDCATNYNPILEKELVEEKDTRLEKIFHFVSSVNKKKEIENKTLPKSPVTILQELMVQMGTVPKYDLEYDGTGSHNPVFKYRVYAKNVSATGSGRTKKEAKCEAAFAVLECLRLNQIGDSQPPEEPAGTSAARMRTPGWSSESLRMGRSDALHEAENTPSSIQEAGGITSASHPALVKDSLLQSTTRMQTTGWSNAGLRSDTPHEPETSSCASQEDSGRTSGTHPVLVKDSLLQSAARIETPGWPSAGLRMGRSDAPCVADGSPSATEESIGIPSAAQPVLVEDSRFPSSARMQIAGWSTESLHTGPSDAPHDADGSLFATQDDGGIPSTSHPALVKDSLFRSAPRIQTPGWSSAILEMGPCDASHEVAVIPSSTKEAGGIPSSIPEAGGISSATQEAGCIPTAPQEADGIPSATPEAGGNPSTPHPVYLKDSLFRSAARMRTAGLSSAGLRMGSSDAPHMAESSLYATNEDGGSPSAAQPVIVKDSLLGSTVRMQTPGWSREGLHMGPSDAPHAADGSPSASLEAGGITSMPHTILTKDALFQCGSAIHKQTPEWSSTSLVMDSSDAPHEADGSPSSTQEAGGISSAAQPVLVKDTLSREAQYQTEIEKIVIDKHHDTCATIVTPMPKNELIEGKESRLEKILTFVSSISKKQEMAIGSGRSKKEAKHEAARVALERLSLSQIEDSQPQEEPVEIVTPYKDKIQENAIGELHDMCATNDIPMPEYELVEEKGAPHEKIFTFVCSVSKQKEIGIGRTKKQAKQLAAYSMMNRLKESLADVLTELKEERHVELDNDNFEQAIAKYMATIGTPRRKFRLNRSPSKYENFFADVPQDFIDAAVKVLKEIPLPKNENERKELDVDWMLQLTRVMECLNASTMLMPGKHMKNGNKSLFLQINLSTEASFFGVGKSADEAIQDAAYSALEFINIQLRNVKKAHDLA